MPGGRGPEPRAYPMNGEVHASDLQDRFKEVRSLKRSVVPIVSVFSKALLKRLGNLFFFVPDRNYKPVMLNSMRQSISVQNVLIKYSVREMIGIIKVRKLFINFIKVETILYVL